MFGDLKNMMCKDVNFKKFSAGPWGQVVDF